MLHRLTNVVDAGLDWLGIWTLVFCLGLWGEIFKWKACRHLSFLALSLPAWSGGAMVSRASLMLGPLRALALPLLA